jgi:hypothetical protein
MQRFLDPADLVLVDHALPVHLKKLLFRQVCDRCQATVLVSPEQWVPISRLLILDAGSHPSERFLANAAQLARSLQAFPVVLTVARSEEVARRRQQSARETLAHAGVSGDFDLMVGSEVRAAVIQVARWRRAQVVVREWQSVAPWWRWWRGNPMERVIDMVTGLSFLTFPEGGVADFPLLSAGTASSSEESILSPACR